MEQSANFILMKNDIKHTLETEYKDIIKIHKINNLKSIILNISVIAKLFLIIIILTESIQYHISKDEKLLLASSIIDDYLEFGWLLEFFDGIIIELLISFAVKILDIMFGKAWDISILKNKI